MSSDVISQSYNNIVFNQHDLLLDMSLLESFENDQDDFNEPYPFYNPRYNTQ